MADNGHKDLAGKDPDSKDERVSDALSDNWTYRFLPRSVWPYAQLARWDRPIGWQLLMWPCFWSSALAANVAKADQQFYLPLFVFHLFLFFLGSVAMRGAGCTWNDLVDHEIDQKVARTRSRPLPSGRVTRRQAQAFLAAQLGVGLLVLLQFNTFSILLAISSLLVVAIYPFAKRFTDWPQFFLGLAFSWGALMGWAGIFGTVSISAVLLYVGAVLWTIGYDTIYAHQDKEDDALVGVRSTARLFGDRTKLWLWRLYGATFIAIAAAFALAGVGFFAYLGLLAGGAMLVWQIRVLNIDDPVQCLALFKANNRVGGLIFSGLILALLFLPG